MSPVAIERPTMSRSESGASTASREKEKEKEKKGGFFSKKKEKEKKGKEKDGFLGSLFGGKKKTEEPSSIANFSSAGPAAAAALLGSSKSAKSLGFSPGASPTSPGFNSFARYPIHVERAVYRLSHIKLANARRPLYEQVLISNLMFWYLGVIGRNVAEEKKPNGVEEKKEEIKPTVKGTPPKASDSGVAGTIQSPIAGSIPSPKKTGLTKPDRSRGGRDNEAPVRTPSYGMQNVQVDNELRNANLSMGMKMAPRSQPQQIQQQHPAQHPQFMNQSFQPGPPQSQSQPHPSQQLPGFNTNQRPISNHAQPSRTYSTPIPGLQQRPASDIYPNQPQLIHPEIQPPPRGLPQSSFGPPPPVPGQPPLSQPMIDGRDPRQRTLSNPPGGSHQPPPNTAGMRRVVTDGRSTYPPIDNRERLPISPHRQHFGPQPGQIFAYPGLAPQPGHPFPPRPQNGAGPGPGQIFNGAQPGQVFHHPHPQYHGQARPPQPSGPPLRLPPGAGPGPGHGPFDHPYLGTPGQGQPIRRGPSPGTDSYDTRRSLPQPLPQSQHQQGGLSPSPPPHSPNGNAGPSYYPQGVASTQPGQIFNPYQARPLPARQTSGEEMYRRAQAVPQGGPYAHHR